MSHHAGRAFAIHWSELPQWDPLTASLAARFRTSYPLVPLGAIATVRWELATKAQLDSGDVKMVERVSFDGEIYAGGKDSTKMDQWVARPGDLLVSKIRARQGSVGLVSEAQGLVSGSIHYRSLTPDSTKVDAVYAWLTLRSEYCRAQFLAATGGAMKGEISEERLLALNIPLPPLATQQAIVDHWKATQKKNAAALRAADEYEAALHTRFVEELGLNAAVTLATKRAFALRWAEIERWGVDGLRKAAESIDLAKGLYPVSPLGELVEMVQYGTSEKANIEGRGVPVLRMNNVHEGVLRLHSIKHVELPARERENLLLKDGDILFNRTNSKELVGKCGVFHEQDEYVYASYLIRVRTKPDVADPDYVAFVINGPIGRQQIDSMSRQIIGQANVNSQELRSLRIPLPPLDIQRQLVAEVNNARARIAAERAAAAKLAANTAREVEEMILGHRPMPNAS